MTARGFRAIEKEVTELKTVRRPSIIAAIAEARAHGDLSENAEYHAAREQQSLVEARIRDLDAVIGLAEIVEVSELSGPIKFGATVTLEDEDTGQHKTYQLVSEHEADLAQGRLNIGSPIARALIGKEVGDDAEVVTPRGEKYYNILKIEYI